MATKSNNNQTQTQASGPAVRRHFTQITLDGFRGHRLEVPLFPVTVLAGPNRSGKTSLRDGLSLTLSGRIPGVAADKTGMTDVDTLLECAPASREFAIRVTDSQDAKIAFSFSSGDKTGRRDVTCSFAEGRQNNVHRAKIAARYGLNPDALGLLSLDLEGLRRMKPDDLQRAVMRLCGGLESSWTVSRIVHELIARAWKDSDSAASLAVVNPASGPQHLAESILQEVQINDGQSVRVLSTVTDPREVIAALTAFVEGRISGALSEQRASTEAAKTVIPDAPTQAALDELHATRERAQAVVSEKSEALGALRAQAAEEVRQINAAKAERSQRVQEIAARETQCQQERDACVRQHADLQKQVTSLVQKSEQLLCRTEKTKADLDAHQQAEFTAVTGEVELPEDLLIELATAQRELNDAQSSPEPRLSAEQEKEGRLGLQQETTATAALKSLSSQKATIRAQMQALENRRTRFSNGCCPECGQNANVPLGNIGKELDSLVENEAQLDASIEAQTIALDAARSTIASLNATVKQVNEAARTRLERISAAQNRLLVAEKARQKVIEQVSAAVREASQRERKLAQEESNLRAQYQENEKTLASLVAQVVQLENRINGYKQRLAALAQERDALDASPIQETVSAELVQAGTEAGQAVNAAQAILQGAQVLYEQSFAQFQQAQEARTRRDAAEAEKKQAQLRGAFWRQVRGQLNALERDILTAFLEPLAMPVNELIAMAEATNVFGTLTARFAPRFSLGFEIPAGQGQEESEASFVPLTQLSDGHFAIAMAMIATAIHMRLGNDHYRGIALDGAEAVDSETRPLLLQMLSWLVSEDHLDQVIIGAVEAYDWEGYAEGLKVVDLRRCTLAIPSTTDSSEAMNTNNQRTKKAA